MTYTCAAEIPIPIQGQKTLDLSEYKKATGLEALFGYLYLKGDDERLKYFVDRMIREYTEGNKNERRFFR